MFFSAYYGIDYVFVMKKTNLVANIPFEKEKNVSRFLVTF